MGHFYSVNNSRKFSTDHVVRSAKVQTALDEYEYAKKTGAYGSACCHCMWNCEDILPPWQQLCLLYMALLILSGVGGVIFYMAEFSTEENLINHHFEYREQLIQKYSNISTLIEGVSQLDMIDEWASEAEEFVYEDPPINKWEFRYASFFAATTYTTTGFGLQYPKTDTGKIIVLIYAFPSFLSYVYISKSIGLNVLSLCASAVRRFGCISEEFYQNKRLSIVGLVTSIIFFGMAYVIYAIRTDEGFGNGIDTYGVALYFLFQTTMTIGYGDVMMSGSSAPVTMILGCWLATSIGVFVCLLSEIGASLEELHRKANNQISRRISSLRLSRFASMPGLELGEMQDESRLSIKGSKQSK